MSVPAGLFAPMEFAAALVRLADGHRGARRSD